MLRLQFFVVVVIFARISSGQNSDLCCDPEKGICRKDWPDECNEAFQRRKPVLGVARLKVGVLEFNAYCERDLSDRDTMWTVILRRQDGNVDFNRAWAAYEMGFGTLFGDYFIGLRNLYMLTRCQRYELMIEMVDQNGEIRYAHYDRFVVGPADDGYRIESLGSYDGTAGDAMERSLSMKFSTFDNENDGNPTLNCAYIMKAGWWFSSCYDALPTGVFCAKNQSQSITWPPWHGLYYSLPFIKMRIRPYTNRKPYTDYTDKSIEMAHYDDGKDYYRLQMNLLKKEQRTRKILKEIQLATRTGTPVDSVRRDYIEICGPVHGDNSSEKEREEKEKKEREEKEKKEKEEKEKKEKEEKEKKEKEEQEKQEKEKKRREEEIKKLEEAKRNIEEEKRRLEEQKKEIEEKTRQLEQEKKQKEKETRLIDHDNKEKEKKRKLLEEKNKAIEEDSKRLEDKVEAMLQQNAKLQQEETESQQRLQNLRETELGIVQGIDRLREQLKQGEQEQKSKEEEQSRLRFELLELQQDIAKRKEELEALAKSSQDQPAKLTIIANLRIQLEQKMIIVKEKEKKLKETEADQEHWRALIKNLKTVIEREENTHNQHVKLINESNNGSLKKLKRIEKENRHLLVDLLNLRAKTKGKRPLIGSLTRTAIGHVVKTIAGVVREGEHPLFLGDFRRLL